MAGRGTAQAPSVASMADRQHGSRAPLDPRAILTSIGEVIYDWDIATDAISWGLNAADVLGCRDASLLSSGKAQGCPTGPATACASATVKRRESRIRDAGTPTRAGSPLSLTAWFASTAPPRIATSGFGRAPAIA